MMISMTVTTPSISTQLCATTRRSPLCSTLRVRLSLPSATMQDLGRSWLALLSYRSASKPPRPCTIHQHWTISLLRIPWSATRRASEWSGSTGSSSWIMRLVKLRAQSKTWKNAVDRSRAEPGWRPRGNERKRKAKSRALSTLLIALVLSAMPIVLPDNAQALRVLNDWAVLIWSG